MESNWPLNEEAKPYDMERMNYKIWNSNYTSLQLNIKCVSRPRKCIFENVFK
jgi:hypothetical protein